MRNIEKDVLENTVGGASISGAILNALTTVGKFVYSMGQTFGSALRRISTRKMCKCR